MNAVVQAALTAALAELDVTSSTPSAPFGYGSDLWCEGDLHPRMIEVSDDALLLAQYCLRRLDTPSGLPDVPEWGIDLASYLNRATTRRELAALEGLIITELTDDDRIDEVQATVTASQDQRTLWVKLRIVPLDPRAAEFTLTLSVSDAGLLLEELTR